jgi:tRNA(fMet)-specific endonuclease VapC
MRMTGSAILDTNAVIAIFANDASLRQLLSGVTETFVPVIVLGELYYGANKSARAAVNVARIDAFVAACPPLLCDATTSQHYGRIKNVLRAKGQPIPENDIWIAALAQQHNLSIVTRDAHFAAVDGLTTVAW